ncbi:MFS transporter [Streptomyces lydicus]|uniref:MFS transporter n=1 Tax=Streptomyces lydicus TaxID=47763 RepID=UPI00340297F3
MSTPAVPAAGPLRQQAARARRWPLAIWVVLVGTFIVRSASFAYPFLAYHLTTAGLPQRWIGPIMAVFGTGWLIGQLTVGWLADRIGHRHALVVAMATAAIVLPWLGMAHSVPALCAAAVLAGACYDAHRPILSALIADVMPDQTRRAELAGWRHFAVNLGAALTGVIGGLLVDQVGTHPLFWANAVVCALFGLAAWRFVGADHPSPAATATDGCIREPGAWRDGRLWLLCLASLAALTCAVGLFSSLPILMAARGLSATAYGGTQAINALVVIVLSPMLTPWLSRRATASHPLLGALATGALVLGVGMGAAGLATTTAGFAAAVATAVPGELIVFIAAADVLNRIAPAPARGLYAGIWGAMLAGAVILAPLLTTYSLAHGGPHTVALTTLATGVSGAVLCIPLHHLLRTTPRTRSSEPQPAHDSTDQRTPR